MSTSRSPRRATKISGDASSKNMIPHCDARNTPG